jgi:DNA-binding NarL/FixJ family response regulator
MTADIPDAPPGARPLRVVLAEDGDLVRAGVLALLERFPEVSVVGTATSLAELLRVVDDLRPDVLLTDVRMPPGFSDEGIRAAAQLRTTMPGLAVLVLTQYADVEYALDLTAEGSAGRGYLLKERVADAAELVRALHTVADGGSVIDETVVDALMRASRRRAGPLDRLTPRELDVLSHVAQGMSNQAIADALVVTPRAVEKHINSFLAKLDLPGDESVNRRVAATLVFLSSTGTGGVHPAARRAT